VGSEDLTPYQRRFIESRGDDPDNPATKRFALAGFVPRSPEDAAHRHLIFSAYYALDVIRPLREGDLQMAKNELIILRKKAAEEGETLAYEALMKLLALNVISDTHEGGIVNLSNIDIEEAHSRLQELISTPKPE
jgi:hypothetical protein